MRLRRQYPAYRESGFSLDVEPLLEKVAGDLRKPLLVLMGAVGMLALIACVNVSNLLLARGVARRREIGIRAALGATYGRIVRQLLMESLLLAVIGDAAGLLLALEGLHLYAQFGPPGLIHGARPALNGWVMAFSIGLSVAASLVFGMAPALETSRVNLHEALKANSHGLGQWKALDPGSAGHSGSGGIAHLADRRRIVGTKFREDRAHQPRIPRQ